MTSSKNDKFYLQRKPLLFIRQGFYSLFFQIFFYDLPLPTTAFRIKSTGIIVAARITTVTHPTIPNGSQLNIFPIHVNSGNGMSAAFTINACTRIIAKKTFINPVFSFKPLKIAKESSLTLNPLNSALTINNTK